MAVIVETSVEKARQEVVDLIQFMQAENVLTSKGFEHDLFVLLANFIAANPENMAAKLCFESAKHLYRRYGRRSTAYIKLVAFLYNKFVVNAIEGVDLKAALKEFGNYIVYESFATSDYNDFIRLEYSNIVLDAIYKANGDYLRVRHAEAAPVDKVQQASFFEFDTTNDPQTIEQAKVLVAQKLPYIHCIMLAQELAAKQEFLVVIQERPEKRLIAASKDIDNLLVVDARPDYKTLDFIEDLKAYVNQDLIAKPERLSVDMLGVADVVIADKVCQVYSKNSYLRRLRQQYIDELLNNTRNPMLAQAIQARARNMSSLRTTIQVAAPSDLEANYKVSKYASEILEISAIIRQGYITNIVPEFKEYKNYPAELFTECYVKAEADLKHLMEPVRVRQIREEV